jgi:hypothetical protein
MAVFQISVDIKEDGVKLPGFPIVKSVTVTESKGKQVFSRPDSSGVYTELPLQELAGVSVLLVQADQAVAFRFNDQSDAFLPISANGLLLLVDAAISSGATNKAALENDSGSAANVTMVSGGS